MQMGEAEDDSLEERYEGQWSEWSQPVAFPSPRKGGCATLPAPWGPDVGPEVSLLHFCRTCCLWATHGAHPWHRTGREVWRVWLLPPRQGGHAGLQM